MAKLNAVLLALLIGCSIAAVSAQHKARKLFVELERARQQAKQLDVEFTQLQLEASTWAMHSRIEKIASTQLTMRVPAPGRIQVLPTPAQATKK